jgi:hypothetical protein
MGNLIHDEIRVFKEAEETIVNLNTYVIFIFF